MFGLDASTAPIGPSTVTGDNVNTRFPASTCCSVRILATYEFPCGSSANKRAPEVVTIDAGDCSQAGTPVGRYSERSEMSCTSAPGDPKNKTLSPKVTAF